MHRASLRFLSLMFLLADASCLEDEQQVAELDSDDEAGAAPIAERRALDERINPLLRTAFDAFELGALSTCVVMCDQILQFDSDSLLAKDIREKAMLAWTYPEHFAVFLAYVQLLRHIHLEPVDVQTLEMAEMKLLSRRCLPRIRSQ